MNEPIKTYKPDRYISTIRTLLLTFSLTVIFYALFIPPENNLFGFEISKLKNIHFLPGFFSTLLIWLLIVFYFRIKYTEIIEFEHSSAIMQTQKSILWTEEAIQEMQAEIIDNITPSKTKIEKAKIKNNTSYKRLQKSQQKIRRQLDSLQDSFQKISNTAVKASKATNILENIPVLFFTCLAIILLTFFPWLFIEYTN